MIAVAAGYDHSLALRSDGTVWAWGDNSLGELGNGTTTQAQTPVQVPGLTNVVAIAAGDGFSLALRSDGTVWGWGYNVDGELGNATTKQADSPVQVTGLSGVVGIAAGVVHALAVTSGGAVYAWGSNADGQLGNNSTTNSSVPVLVSGISTAVQVAAGANHSLALLSNGTVEAWGDNAQAQLGNNSTTNSEVPVLVSGVSGVTQVSAGVESSAARTGSGQLYTWGDNTYGELGLGTTTSEKVPTRSTAAADGVQALSTGSEASHLLLIAQPHTALSATTLAFSSESVGTTSTSLPETVTNNGLVALVIGQAQIVGADGDQFAFAGDGCSNTTVAPGASCTIYVQYDAKISNSPVATLRIPSNSPTSPDTATLDPPAPAPAATATPATVSCRRVQTRKRSWTLACTLTHPTPNRRERLSVRLLHDRRSLATTHASTDATHVTVRLKLPHTLAAGRYTLQLTLDGVRQKPRTITERT
jgi:hypothetical protein